MMSIDIPPVRDIENKDNGLFLVDAVDDPIIGLSSSVATFQRPNKWFVTLCGLLAKGPAQNSRTAKATACGNYSDTPRRAGLRRMTRYGVLLIRQGLSGVELSTPLG